MSVLVDQRFAREMVRAVRGHRPNVRWVGNGQAVKDNKGNVLKAYEPYYSSMPNQTTRKPDLESSVDFGGPRHEWGPRAVLESQVRAQFRARKPKSRADPPLNRPLVPAEPIHDGRMARATPPSLYCPPATAPAPTRLRPRTAAANTSPQETPPAHRPATTPERSRTSAPTLDPARPPPAPSSYSTPRAWASP